MGFVKSALLVLVCLFFARVPARAEVAFLRGDVDQSGFLDLSDPVQVLGYLFLGTATPSCLDVADANDDGALNLTDAVRLLDFLYLGGAAPGAPYPNCGEDPTEDQLGCASYSAPNCSRLPRLLSAMAPSNHFVAIELNVPIDGGIAEMLLSINAYSIRAADQSHLEILEVRRDPSEARRVLLATASQQVVAYTLTVNGVEGPSAGAPGGGQANGGSIVFQGSDDAEPRPISAISLGSTETEGKILLTYSEPMEEGLLDVRFYQIADPDLEIRRVELSTIGVLRTTVILTTEPQRNLFYSLKITNVKSRSGAFVVDPTRNIVTFQGIPAVDTTPPLVLGAEPTSNTTIVLSFSEPLRPGSEDPRNFIIRCFDPFTNTACPDLIIEGTELTALGTQIVLTTLPQMPGMQYTVEILNRCDSLPDRDNCLKDIQENPISPTGDTAVFTGLDRDRPYLASAISLGPDAADPTRAYVLLTFSEPVLEGADTVAFYSITNPDLDIFAASLSLDGLTVTLTTSAQDPVAYTVKATNIVSRGGGYALDPTRSSAAFVGIPPVDTIPPRVTAAVSTSLTSVAVAFSEPLLPGAADALNFRITCHDPVSNTACADLVVTGATLTNFGTQIVLNTLPQTADVEYTVTVLDRCTESKDACVKDLQGNRIDPAANTATFVFDGNPLLSELRPRVVGAASTSNTTVVVTFSKTMDRSAENASNYFIVQVNVNPEVGFLVVNSARFLDPDHTSVELSTLSQNEVTYSVTAVNVRDLAGNQMEPPLIVHGIGLISAATAQFPGTPPTEGQIADTDGDGLADNREQRGWVVTVELSDGSTIQRQVTSSPFSADTDLDGLDDPTELEIGSDPRTADTDGDQLDDNLEFNVLFSNQNNQDSDSDEIDDNLEVGYFRTNLNVDDSDGDGFSDSQELFVMHRDPRIADLPSPGIGVDSLNLLLEETFSFTNESGEVQEASSSTTTSLSSSSTRTVSTTFGAELGFNVSGTFKGGLDGITDTALVETISLAEAEAGLNFGLSFQVSRESSQTMTNAFDASLSKGRTVTNSLSSTRNVNGGRVDALIRLKNLSDVAFSLENLEITVSAPDPVNRTKFVPIATLIPNSELVTGSAAVFSLGVFNRGLGPILFSSRDVVPTLVEDLLRDPRGLLFEIANFNVTDEFGRNFAFASQMARDRTVGLSVDFGDGNPEQFLVAIAPVRNNRGEIVGGYSGFSGTGPYPPLPLEFILEETLALRRSRVQVPAVWTAAAGQRPLVETFERCDAGDRIDEACDDDTDCPGGACTAAVVPADGILVGANGVSDSIAEGDDVQLIPFGIDGLPPEAVVIDPGEDGVLDSGARGDDILAVVTGYATTSTCGPDTPSSIRPGPNGIVDTLRDPFSDDVQVVLPKLGAALATDVILPGPNGFIDTAPAGDDVFVGPSVPCSDDADCPAPGVCNGQEKLFRFKHRERGQFGRAWAVLLPDSSQLGVDFRKIQVRPGNLISLSFIQDLDRDGLISDVEFVFGSADTRQDTDGDGLDDFSEIRVGWEVGVEGSPLRRVFPDPRFPDSDDDRLSDREEQDIRRVQCECDGGANAGQSCTNIFVEESCPGANCVNVADRDTSGSPTTCSSLISANRLDPRRRDTDDDLVSDADEVLGWLTQAATIDPVNVVVAGPNRTAESLACPDQECLGGANDGLPCRFDRDCPTLRRCQGGVNQLAPCTNDIECQGPTPATSGLCEEDPAEVGVCNRPTPCDDVQVLAPGTFAGNQNAVAIAPGPNGRLESVLGGDDLVVGNAARPGDRRGSTKALGDDQQIRLAGECLSDDDLDGLCDGVCEDDLGVACETDADCATRCVSAPLERIILRPGVNGILDTLPNNHDALGDDVRARGQYLQTTNPLSGDTDRDQISEGFERILGSDPRNAADGGLLGDKDGDGLSDGQEEFVGWIVRAVTAGGVVTRRVFSNPNSPDSDLDSLPDFLEHELGTDPTSQDTDADGLSDFDEISEAQLTDFERFNDFFPGFFLDGSRSMAYGTNPLANDTDGDTLTDDFELLVGWNVTVPTERGQEVRHVLTEPTNPDTDFDGLNDNLERIHTVGGLAAPSSDPTDFDSDDDGRTDGVECPTASCLTNPLVPDKRVTIRYVLMTLERGSEDGGLDLVDVSYSFGAKKSTEPFLPSQQRFVSSNDASDCPGDHYSTCNPPQCQVNEGTDIVFNRMGATEGNILKNERVFALEPRQGLLLNGVVDQWDSCPGNTLHIKGLCTEEATGIERDSCCDTVNSTDCPAGQKCKLSSFEPRTCQGCGVVGVNGRSCVSDGDCIVALGPLTCGRCLGTRCTGQPGGPCEEHNVVYIPPSGEARSGLFDMECRPATTNNPTGHIVYLKTLSYETLQDGFSTDIVTLNDSGAGGIEKGFGVQLTVEIIVE